MRIYVFEFLVFAMCLGLFSSEFDKTSKVYSKRIIVDAAWGEKPGEFAKLENLEEDWASGPPAFSVDSKEDIYIIDILQKRVQKFNSNGDYVSMFVYDTLSDYMRQFWATDITTDTDGEIYLLGYSLANPYVGEVRKYDKNGSFKHGYDFTVESLNMDSIIPEGLRGTAYKLAISGIANSLRLSIRDDKVMVNDLVLGIPDAQYSKMQKYLTEKEFGIERKIRCNSHYSLLIKLFERKVWISLPQTLLAGVRVTKIDTQKNIYLLGRRRGHVWEEEFLKYDSKGALVGNVIFQPRQKYEMFRYYFIDEKNNFYVMENDKNGLRIIKYEEKQVQNQKKGVRIGGN